MSLLYRLKTYGLASEIKHWWVWKGSKFYYRYLSIHHKYVMYRLNRGERHCNECGHWFNTSTVDGRRCGLWTCSECQ